ncbi:MULTISPECIES: RsfA family transcriptional regulator [unclassified Virgibacillus]|uniref:RsfA family transcriptional regulator n=1 Tax=unclassified Virgibacillus TaxID=2620237 RepID=UPI0024DE7CB7|nr:RsfA family transcriptional regulator [Virgibacillus sp. LDC-1]
MAKVRQDAWSHEDDLLLAETVLRHIRDGSTQLNAFEEVGDKLNRTSAACGFRWNAEIRKKYENAIDLAKRQRKEKKRALQTHGKQTSKTQPVLALPANLDNTEKNPIEESSISLDSVIHFLTHLKKDYYASNQSKITLEQTKRENEKLKNKVYALENQLKETEYRLQTIQEDYQVFVQIMDRARKMTVLDDHDSFQAPAFKMDKNGNLEQLAQSSGN